MGRQVKLSLSSQDVFSVSLSLGESQIQSSKMMSLRILCLVASLVYVHGAIVKRDAGYGSLAPAPPMLRFLHRSTVLHLPHLPMALLLPLTARWFTTKRSPT